MAAKEPGSIDVHVTARPSRLLRPLALALRVARTLRVPPSRAFEDRLIQWLIGRSDVQLETLGKPEAEISS